ncbi:MAG: tRNA threonylcarbamoyladenosine biosynthesis protein TsaE [Candidatus Omnitrophica bacterium]|nr:tRNA threonylcarbamoyladenosine biosynthesis protein TsaE [Candidatus Omnitrophota bacterium]
MKKRVMTCSPGQTESLGRKLALRLRPGQVLTLQGDLGAGKTTFVRGLAGGLGLRRGATVSSPTFVIIHEYPTRVKLYHIDAYRLDPPGDQDLDLIGDCLRPDSIAVIEWPERIADLVPAEALRVRIRHLGGDRRAVEWEEPVSPGPKRSGR